jgi:hypothetical protein
MVQNISNFKKSSWAKKKAKAKGKAKEVIPTPIPASKARPVSETFAFIVKAQVT